MTQISNVYVKAIGEQLRALPMDPEVKEWRSTMDKPTINLYGLDEDAKDKLRRENPDAMIVDFPPTDHEDAEPRTGKKAKAK